MANPVVPQSSTNPIKYKDLLLTGWGRTAPTRARVFRPDNEAQIELLLNSPTERGIIARGLGRSYGDPAQNAGGCVIDMTALNSLHDIDLARGSVEVDAGISLHQLMQVFVPLGLFVPVTPGTRYVTVGGAIASDIHGKNHHLDGTFGRHVESMRILTGDGRLHTATPKSNAELFQATLGGMGLTGIILSARLQMIKIETSAMLVDTRRVRNLEELMASMVAEDERYRYSVAWVDTLARGKSLGRGVLYRGNHATTTDLESADVTKRLVGPGSALLSVPGILPSGLINRRTTALFNNIWYRKHPSDERERPQQLSAFFHQLDMLEGSNRLYGPTGFAQHQCVLPDGAEDTLRAILETFSRERVPTSLVVLKRMGPESHMLSFPLHGWTLAVDVPANWIGLADFLDRIDERVVEAGGRLYLAKDSRMNPKLLETMYPELSAWRDAVARYDPDHRFTSDLSRRLELRG